jgi:hypothetical protein
MNSLLRLFMFMAFAGFIASLIAHIAGYMGIEKPLGFNPWPLHMGIFIVWLPAVLMAQRLSKDFPQKDMWKATLRGCPPWMRKALYILFGYVFLSFFLFIALDSTSGNEANTIRGFSGHWLIFYFAAYAILYSAIQVSENENDRRCKSGHLLEPNDKYCRQCGEYAGPIIE